jgi:thioredoxin-like negative regulator of GroEL
LSGRAARFAILLAAALGIGPVLGCGSGKARLPRYPHDVERPEQPTANAAEALPFIHDDYPRALAEAKRTKRPIFVDAWATWCHSCQSMRAFVLTNPKLAPLANDFVWLTIDTEKDSNAAFVGRFTNHVWPTLWVVDAERESPVLRWEGTATAPELLTLLATVKDGAREGGAEMTVAFLRANQAASRGEVAEAERAYRELVARRDFPERARAVEALVGLLSSKKDHAACAELAVAEAARIPPGTSRATLLATGLSCARDAKRAPEMQALAAAAERAASDPDPRTIDDDRSALFEELVETKKEQGDEAGAKAMARTWASFLEQAAARAPNKEARAVFDPHRLSAYLAAGEPERAIPMLLESERAFPDDYNPPARLARAFLTMKRLDDAHAAIDRAAARVYGPRSLRVLGLAAEIAKARADVPGERAALEQALTRTEHAVLNENQKKLRAEIAERLRALGK